MRRPLYERHQPGAQGPQWSPPVHRFAPQSSPPPNYVGPSWAAPGPYRPPPPPKKKSVGCGCVAIALAIFLVVPALLVGLGAIAFSILGDLAEPRRPRAEGRPAEVPFVPTGDPKTDIYSGGFCRAPFSNERDRGTYEVIGGGSARALRGKVAILHLKATAPGATWPVSSERKMKESAMLAQRFYLEQAKRRGVRLEVDAVPWTVSVPASLPALRPLPNRLFSQGTMMEIRAAVRRAVESGMGKSLESLVGEYRKKGYDEVAFIAYFPHDIQVRDFAFRESRGSTEAELAVVFPTQKPLPFLAVQVAHEGLHMFGADDLYRLPVDAGDAADLMGDYCEGFKQTRVGDATAFSIGWTPAAPKRVYGFRQR